MGIRGRSRSERLRTIWTPEMDRYFIELLVEQVSKGNKFDDHLFSKRAWKHMTLLFNARFKFQYEKDVLKNRHKTLRNLYKAVKKLLDQNGFTWDENRQMVTADNCVWEDYIKVHPDARAYRIKTIPYYSDLCLIYGEAGIEEKGDNVLESSPQSADNEKVASTHLKNDSQGAVPILREIRVDEDYRISVSESVDDSVSQGVVLNDVQQATVNATGSTATETMASNRSRTYWQPPMDRYFIDFMLEQMEKGNQIDGVFRKQAWMDMIASFNAKFGFNYDLDVLKNRYKTLRRQYNVIKNLLELDGFAWDDTRQMVTADDCIWQDYIKTHTDARQFMTRPIPYFKDLCKICSDQNVEGSDCFSAQYLELQNDVQEVKLAVASQSSESPIASVFSEDEVGDLLEVADPGSETGVLIRKNKRQSESWSNSGPLKKSRGKEEVMASAAQRHMVTAVSSLTDKKDGSLNSVSIENVIAAVQALPDIDEDLILDACDLLEDETKAKVFMALDAKLRKKWLLRKLRTDS